MFKRKKFKYERLKPGERIRKLIEEFVQPDLSEYGFKLLKSELTFKRKVGDFSQEIYFAKNRRNFGNSIVSFWTILSVKSNEYVRWHEKTYGFKPINEFVDSWYDNHINNWSTKYWTGGQYDLVQFDNVRLMNDLNKNIQTIGLPLLNQLSDWESAADFLFQKERWMYCAKIFDFYIKINEKDKAEKALRIMEEYFKGLPNDDVPKERFEEMDIRKDYLQQNL